MVLTSILFKDRDSPRDTSSQGPIYYTRIKISQPFFIWCQILFLKSSSYAMKSSGKHLLGSLSAVSKDGIKVYLQRNGEFHDRKNSPRAIKEEVEIPKAERIMSAPHRFCSSICHPAPTLFLQWQDVWWELEHEPIEMVSTSSPSPLPPPGAPGY